MNKHDPYLINSLLCLSTVLIHFCLVAQAIPVDNGVEGEPFIECGATFIGVTFNTRNPFEGHVFVKTLYNQPVSHATDAVQVYFTKYLALW